MPRRLYRLFSLLVILLQVSCYPSAPAAPTQILATITTDPNATASPTPFGPSTEIPTVPSMPPTLPAPATAEPSASPTSAITPTTTLDVSLPYYSLDATLDYAAHTLSVDETILYSNTAGADLSSLVLAVEPNIWKNCFKLAGLMVNGQLIKDLHPDGNRLDVPLPAVLSPGASLNVILHYDLALPPADPYHIFGYDTLQTNLVDWFPFIVPYSNGWLLHPPSNVGENLVYPSSTFDVIFRLKDPSQPMTVAASAPAEASPNLWHYRLPSARTFALSVSPYFQAATQSINSVPITSYYFESEKPQALKVLGEVGKAVSTYASLFGSFPYPSLSIVESPYYDGMEYDGLFLLSRDFYLSADDSVMNNLVDIAVHETAHQWWFGQVGSDQALQPWLDEALATYSEELFYEKNYPDVANWEQFRIDSFYPSGWVDTDIYAGLNFRSYANAVYLRGALFLRDLRHTIGDEAFLAFFNDYASQMSGRIATSADFFRILRQHTTADLSGLIKTYFQDPY